ncbi:hypothetical protein K7X08_000022 [Anisodus acutangulus]|uniref:Uncharacterized protein n=1 Tax=Anisodus acutangulus TaxID=402998 RepID=A0A9Q1MCH2_9SOLA|nr:hypothetical protein K7X08_000022 [Anisodus acutangulus]
MLTKTKNQHDENVKSCTIESYSTCTDPNKPSTDDVVKSFSLDKYSVKMSLDVHNDLSDDIIENPSIRRNFDKFRAIRQEEILENFFRANYFGHYLDFLEEIAAQF